MRLYGLKMFNFMRFGESGNSIVFDVTEEQKTKIKKGELTFDSLYASITEDPLAYTESVKTNETNVLKGIIGIAGMTADSFDASNGSGKSTIFEAISYLMYDRIVRQTANNDKKAIAGTSVVTKLSGSYPKGLRESYVEAYFEEDGRLYRLKRGKSFAKTHKSNSPIFELDEITKDGDKDSLSGHVKKSTQESLDEIIVEDYDIFVNTVMFGQNDAGKFLVGTDKVKKNMIIEILKLEHVVHGCIDVVRSRKKTENELLSDHQSRSSSLQEQVLKAYREFEDEDTEYSVKLAPLFVEKVQKLLDDNKSKIGTSTEAIEKIDEKINTLENSEVIQQINKIIEDGKAIASSKAEKENRYKADLDGWDLLRHECELKKKQSSEEISSIQAKVKSKELSLKLFEDNVSSFDENKHNESVENCNKLIAVKEKYTNMKVDANEKFNKILDKVREFDAVISVNESEKKHAEDQISKAGDKKEFLCSECRHIVTKDHYVSKIEAISKVVEQNRNSRYTVAAKGKKIKEAIVSIEDRIEKIAKAEMDLVKLESAKKDFTHAKSNMDSTKDSVKEYQESIEKIDKTIKEYDVKLVEYAQKSKELTTIYEKEVKSLDEELVAKRQEVTNLRKDAKELEDQIATLKGEKDKLNSEIKLIQEKNGSLQQKIDQVNNLATQILDEDKKALASKKKLQTLAILEKAFGLEGVQTRIVAKYLPQLNLHVKEYLDILSNGSVSVDIFINSKSKVDMKIIGGTADDYVMLSGGEKMIVRLAVDIGLSLLSFSRTAKVPDMICLDEIFGPLDKDHTESVFVMLNRLKKKFNRVFLISHKREIQSLVENNIIIKKNSGNLGLSRVAEVSDISV